MINVLLTEQRIRTMNLKLEITNLETQIAQ